jgi:hypothetical protein
VFEAGNNEVLSGPVNNLMEDDLKFNIVKKEANPEVRRKNTQRGNGKKAGKKNKGKPRRRNQRGNRKNAGRKHNGKPRRRNQKGNGKNAGKKGKGNLRRRNRKGNGKNAGKKHKKKQHNGKPRNKGGKKKTKKGTKGKLEWEERKSQKGSARQLLCNSVPEASKTISTGIISYRKYFNHDKQIKRTKNHLDKLVKKSMPEKLVKYTTAADELKSLTTDGTNCPADNTAARSKIFDKPLNY